MDGLVQITSNEELQDIAYSGMKYICGFCEEHGLQYYLTGGTLLGAVRHQGWIPWDDDIDMGLPRKDYERLISLTQEVDNQDWKLESYEKNPRYMYYWAKLCHKHTVITPSRFGNGYTYGMSIDIFPIDALDRDKSVDQQIREFSQKYRRIFLQGGYKTGRQIQAELDGSDGRTRKQKLIRPIAQILYPDPQTKLRELSDEMAANDWDEAETVGYICLRARTQLWPRRCFDRACTLPFEGRQFQVSADYDELLTLQYGDYMTLPPADQQVSNHTYRAYRLPDSLTYEEYNETQV